MPSRSLIIQLQPGQSQAILPDHRKMLPGIQYVIDWDTFSKLSLGARQNVIQVVSVNSDTTTASTSYVVAQSATGNNAALSLSTVLSTVSQTPTSYSIGGFGAQGYDAGGTAGSNTGVGATYTGNSANQVLTGPAGERYVYVYNASTNISGSQVLTWQDEVARFATNTRPAFLVAQDGQGTQYVTSTVDTNLTPNIIGTKQGRFAGVAIVNIPSGYYGWIQTEGYCPSISVTGTVTAGATLSATATASGYAQAQAATATVVGANNIVTGSPLANNVFGTALTGGTNTTIAGYIRSVSKVKKPYVRFLNQN